MGNAERSRGFLRRSGAGGCLLVAVVWGLAASGCGMQNLKETNRRLKEANDRLVAENNRLEEEIAKMHGGGAAVPGWYGDCLRTPRG